MQQSSDINETKTLFRSTGVVGLMTLLSRFLGLVRDIFFARLFGAFPIMDAFFVSFKIPNSFRRFFAEGAFSRAFIPVLSDYKENQDHAEVQELIDRTSGTLGVILFAITVVWSKFNPVLVKNSLVSITLNRTSAEQDSLSLYSTSASARADLQSKHQCTGLCP